MGRKAEPTLSVSIQGCEDAITFLGELAKSSCACTEPGEHCEACDASRILLAAKGPSRQSAMGMRFLLASIAGTYVTDRCDCNWPAEGEDGVMLGTSCRARELVGLRRCKGHVDRERLLENRRARGRPAAKRFGPGLERAINGQGMTPATFAKELEISPSSMSRMLRGLQGASGELLDRMCKRLSCSPAQIYAADSEHAATSSDELEHA